MSRDAGTVRDMESLKKIFRYAKEATSQLGEWCADQVWSLAMAEQEALRLERRMEKAFLKSQDNKPVEVLDDEINRLREAQKFVTNWNFVNPTESEDSLSPKLLVLREYLDRIFERPTDARCIIFVDRRYTARLLKELFTRISSPHLRLGLLVGARNGEPGDLELSVRQQILTLNKFRKGVLNCLVILLDTAVRRGRRLSLILNSLPLLLQRKASTSPSAIWSYGAYASLYRSHTLTSS